MANEQNLKPWKPGQSGNPKGLKKGTKHISTWIQELLNDEEFSLDNFLGAGKQYKGAPIRAIIQVAMLQAMAGEKDWAEWLAKHGYGNKLIIETGDPVQAALEKMGLLEGDDAAEAKDTTSKAS